MNLKFTVPTLEIPTSDVAVVIPSGRLLGSAFGSEIDGFGTVVRFNDFVTEGYEGDVGTKTDAVFCNSNYVDSSFVKQGVNYCYVTGGDSEAYYKLRSDFPTQISRFEAEQFRYRFDLDKFPTAGLCAILALVESGLRPTIFAYNLSDDGYDYYHKESTQSLAAADAAGWHDLRLERHIVRSLLSDNLITCK